MFQMEEAEFNTARCFSGRFVLIFEGAIISTDRNNIVRLMSELDDLLGKRQARRLLGVIPRIGRVIQFDAD
jgi:hypothetical protein